MTAPWVIKTIRSVSRNRLIGWSGTLALLIVFVIAYPPGTLFDHRIEDWAAILMAPAFLLFHAAYGLSEASRHYLDPSTHPLSRRIRNWGTLADVSRDIEHELRTPHCKLDGARFTTRFIIMRTWFKVDILRLEDLIWAYEYQQHDSDSSRQCVKLHWSHTSRDLIVGWGNAKAVLDHCAQQAPWAIAGFNRELATVFEQRKPEIIALVQQRKQQILADAAA
ncbi:hypothetical protein SAMN02745857_00867 [Andreprevotia lacus DSM 23236]|jgi:hypothetical protein|uniref:Uncharacterized protein n=1 Tax=Andreprevotia lacus DSM 23236 TaxID=1121001 RepID=A0A1W1X8F4_9NEIS|nr:hypothetical protein [Andreprevotia lacus]SMC20216.1 hypothetical protein SAMN02745857_00867 [Andreprevotia lacus DSM 23236]